MAAILDHVTPKSHRKAILNPLKQPKPKTKVLCANCIFVKLKMAASGHIGSDLSSNEQAIAPWPVDDPC